MIIAIIYVIISFLLDGIISNIIPFNLVDPSFFKTIYSVISLVIIYNYFDNKKKYLSILIILGILFDIIYTNTFILNIIVFITIYIILSNLDYVIPNNIITINIKSIICISLYHILTYIILLLANYNSYSIKLLFIILLRSLIMTIIYTTISYLIMNKIYDNKKVK
ncbi:MAG: hypothetical protein IJE89_00410 [Bacilli bacterium]|nr:hypothetical protein [Bacilli bacterium]